MSKRQNYNWEFGKNDPKEFRDKAVIKKKEDDMFASSDSSDSDMFTPQKKLNQGQDQGISHAKKIIEEKTQQDEDKGKGR